MQPTETADDDFVAATPQPFHTEPLRLGQPLVDNMDNIAEVLAVAEGEDHR